MTFREVLAPITGKHHYKTLATPVISMHFFMFSPEYLLLGIGWGNICRVGTHYTRASIVVPALSHRIFLACELMSTPYLSFQKPSSCVEIGVTASLQILSSMM